ncbi:hypothetical protein MAV3388_24170 [Mycobacterium avium subsp. hominissuis 3388]|nr:hypothetical protein MAV3388_24170 [Mycobacterium avium subsp. hominissuis 3388]
MFAVRDRSVAEDVAIRSVCIHRVDDRSEVSGPACIAVEETLAA